MNKPIAANSNNPFCILVVDDDEDDLFFLVSALKSSGVEHPVITFETGEDLLLHLKNDKNYCPLLIISDLNMPKKNGKDLLMEIKKDQNYNHIPFIILSTSTQKRDIDECYQLGVNSYLVKPTTVNEMEVIANGIKTTWIDRS